jgi:cell fate regulator YaaT (PSP1 superfamily)
MGCASCSFKKLHSENHDLLSTNIFGSRTAFDWLKGVPESPGTSNIVEVRFKDNKKGFYRNVEGLELTYDDMVTVQEPQGYDVGIVSLKGLLAEKQYLRKVPNADAKALGVIYRKSTGNDIKTWLEGKALEKATLIKSRQFAFDMNLDMKINDVEFQGDGKKVTFYYIADKRIDFRELLKVLSKEFTIKIEMKQIGSRQEAAKIGGVGSCGKELCCSTWRTELPSVPSSTIQAQQLSPNLEKFTGQCGKLKCCLMYELDTYLEAKEEFPKELLELETKKGIAYPQKIDILKKTVWYAYNPSVAADAPVEVALDRVKEIINLNKRGTKVENLEAKTEEEKQRVPVKKTLSY